MQDSFYKIYDLNEVKSVPILKICDQLGINYMKRGKNYWCKVRPEKNASCILHPDSNTFYDFGNQEKGNVIGFVHYASGRNIRDSISFIAENFSLEPINGNKSFDFRPLSNWEYEQIGLYGDMASKNIAFPVFSEDVDKLCEISYMYRFSMNDLKKEFLEGYEYILKERAMPYIASLENQYFREVFCYYELLKMFGKQVDFYDSAVTDKKFKEKENSVYRAKNILYKAAFNTSLDVPHPKHISPQRVISHLLQGKISIILSGLTDELLSKTVENNKIILNELNLDFDQYSFLNLDDIPHCASYSQGKVRLKYYSSFEEEIQCQFYEKKESLSSQIFSAKDRAEKNSLFVQKNNKELVHC